jgi:hypothetical protein
MTIYGISICTDISTDLKQAYDLVRRGVAIGDNILESQVRNMKTFGKLVEMFTHEVPALFQLHNKLKKGDAFSSIGLFNFALVYAITPVLGVLPTVYKIKKLEKWPVSNKRTVQS